MIHVILGAPCSGKSTYVSEHKQDGDIVIDFDKIAQALGSNDPHRAPQDIKSVAFIIREAAIETICKMDCEAWIIHTKPTEKQREMYEAAGAEYIEMTTDMETCLERCESDNRPEGTADVIREYFSQKKGNTMNILTKTIEFKADTGTITGYASTWTREPDAYGDVVAKGAFTECIAKIKEEGKVLPLLFNHISDDLKCYIGKIINLEEDDHGLKFEAVFDDEDYAQRARELALDGRLCKFSFAYDVIDQATVKLDDGREANELRKLNIHEVSLVLYPANPDTSVIEIKATQDDFDKAFGVDEKSGRRNSSKDEEKLRQIIALAQECLGELDDIEQEEETDAKSEERDTVNDEEQTRIKMLMKEATEILTKGAKENDSNREIE